MTVQVTLNDIINRELKDAEFKIHYNRELMINAIAKMVFEMRIKAGLTQKELAEKAHTTQQVISRLEKGSDTRIPSLELLSKIAYATSSNLNITFSSNIKGN